MGKKLCAIAVILCVLILGGKIVYDKVTEHAVYKGLNIIAHVPVEGWFDNSKNETGTQVEENQNGEADGTPAIEGQTPALKGDSQPTESDGISPEDKAYVISIYSRYSASEVNEAYSLMNGKMTPEKKTRIKEIVFSKMTRAEYNKIMQLAEKYGY